MEFKKLFEKRERVAVILPSIESGINYSLVELISHSEDATEGALAFA